MGPDRVGTGREYSDFSLKFERTRSARCARSLVTKQKAFEILQETYGDEKKRLVSF